MVTAIDFKLADVKVESSKAYLLKLRENLSWDLTVIYIFCKNIVVNICQCLENICTYKKLKTI